jgi:hypothetical protein
MIQALAPDGADPALGKRVGHWRRTGVRMIRAPIERHTSSKARLNLVSRSRTRWWETTRRASIAATTLRACWVTHSPVGWAVMPASRPPARADLDEEQPVKPLEKHGVDAEEVARHDARRLRSEERLPRRGGTPRRGVDALGGQDAADRTRGDPPAETGELALDSLIAPSWVIPGEPNDDGSDVRGTG